MHLQGNNEKGKNREEVGILIFILCKNCESNSVGFNYLTSYI